MSHVAGRVARPVILMLTAIAASATAAAGERWYDSKQAEKGRALYAEHCAVCHGGSGEGQPGWQERDEMGFYPPPPLNSDGHAWHHPLAQMEQLLESGGGPLGGTMPSFVDVLDDREEKAVIAYVQSLWPDEIYRQWVEIDAGRAEPPPIAQHEGH
jgi:mono/diheme cytochrome c family protein